MAMVESEEVSLQATAEARDGCLHTNVSSGEKDCPLRLRGRTWIPFGLSLTRCELVGLLFYAQETTLSLVGA